MTPPPPKSDDARTIAHRAAQRDLEAAQRVIGRRRSVVLARTDPDRGWADDPAEIAALWRWLEERGELPSEPVDYFIERCHKWDSEYRRMVREQRETGEIA